MLLLHGGIGSLYSAGLSEAGGSVGCCRSAAVKPKCRSGAIAEQTDAECSANF